MSLATTELTLFIDNTRKLWKLKQTVWTALAKRKRRQDYDNELAVRRFCTIVNMGAKAYVRELNMKETWSTAFPAVDRTRVAKDFEKEFRLRWNLGELDYLLPLKDRPKRRSVTSTPLVSTVPTKKKAPAKRKTKKKVTAKRKTTTKRKTTKKVAAKRKTTTKRRTKKKVAAKRKTTTSRKTATKRRTKKKAPAKRKTTRRGGR